MVSFILNKINGMLKKIIFSASLLFVSLHGFNQGFNESQKITATDRDVDDEFGSAVDISGDYAIVGAFSDDFGAANPNMGSAHIYKKNEAGDWEFTQKIFNSDQDDYDRFGWSVAIHDDIAVVGAYREDHNVADGELLSNAGSVYIFKRNIAGVWSQFQKIVASDRSEEDEFGFSVAIYDDVIVVGAHRSNTNVLGEDYSIHAGAAHIFEEPAVVDADAGRGARAGQWLHDDAAGDGTARRTVELDQSGQGAGGQLGRHEWIGAGAVLRGGTVPREADAHLCLHRKAGGRGGRAEAASRHDPGAWRRREGIRGVGRALGEARLRGHRHGPFGQRPGRAPARWRAGSGGQGEVPRFHGGGGEGHVELSRGDGGDPRAFPAALADGRGHDTHGAHRHQLGRLPDVHSGRAGRTIQSGGAGVRVRVPGREQRVEGRRAGEDETGGAGAVAGAV